MSALTPAYLIACATDGCHALMIIPAPGGEIPADAEIKARVYRWTLDPDGNRCPACTGGRSPVPAACTLCNGIIKYDGLRTDRCDSCGMRPAIPD